MLKIQELPGAMLLDLLNPAAHVGVALEGLPPPPRKHPITKCLSKTRQLYYFRN